MSRIPFLVLFISCCVTLSTADWPHLRGANTDGRATSGAFEGETLSLGLAWRVSLGSGYSGIAVSGGRAVTMFTEGEVDWLAAFDGVTGEPLWRHSLGPFYKGRDGADDGPLSSPTISDGTVYLVTPRGELQAVALASGKPRWSRNLVEEFDAVAPSFGFTTSPLVVGDVLIVQAGGKGDKSIVALNKKSGELIWSDGDAGVTYQSPALLELADKQQVVAAHGKKLGGYDPASGKRYWELELEEGNLSSANPTAVGKDRFLVYVSGAATVFEVTEEEGKLGASELYKTSDLGRTYAPPVHHQGHLYGFKDAFLSCLDAASGERIWRSRPPGGRGLLLVNDTLVIYAAQGNVVLAHATPEGYRERSRLEVFEGSAYTWPSFSDGLIYVRNLEEMAALRVSGGGLPIPRRAEKTKVADHEFQRWLNRVATSENPAAQVEELLKRHESAPLVDGEMVTFILESDAGEVAIEGTMLDSGQAHVMERVPGTRLFHASFQLGQAGRFEYRFQLDLEEWTTDPRNPREVPAVEGSAMLSELVMPGYRLAPHLTEKFDAAGRLDQFTLSSAILEDEKTIKVWLPPGYDDSQARYPLLVVNDGESWLERGKLVDALEFRASQGDEVPVAVFVPAAGRWWTEAGGTRTAEYARMQAEELLPALDERYRLSDAAATRVVMGNRFYGFSAAYAALKHPEVFGAAVVQSVYFGLGAEDELASMIESKANSDLKIYIDWNSYEERNVDSSFDIGEDSRRLAALFESHGYRVEGGQVADSYGWGGWRTRSGRLLSLMFPSE